MHLPLLRSIQWLKENSMPKVVRFYELAGPEALKFEEQPIRQPKAGEVRIRVQAVGLNRAEALYTRGQYLEQPRLPSGLGYEAAGIVEAAQASSPL
jgi:NADPH2:quinone reductase